MNVRILMRPNIATLLYYLLSRVNNIRRILLTLVIINNLLADVLIRQTFFLQMFKKSQFAEVHPDKLSRYTVAECKFFGLFLVSRCIHVVLSHD